MKSTLTFAHESSALQFGLGDVLSTGDIVNLKGEIQVGAENALLQWALTALASDVATARAGTDAEVGQ